MIYQEIILERGFFMSERSNHLPGLIKGMVVSILLTFILLLGLCCLCYFLTVSEQLLSLLVFLVTGISIFFGAFLTSLRADSSGLLHGLIHGFFYLLIVFVWGLVVNKGFFWNTHLLSMSLCILASGMLGGILGINFKN